MSILQNITLKIAEAHSRAQETPLIINLKSIIERFGVRYATDNCSGDITKWLEYVLIDYGTTFYVIPAPLRRREYRNFMTVRIDPDGQDGVVGLLVPHHMYRHWRSDPAKFLRPLMKFPTLTALRRALGCMEEFKPLNGGNLFRLHPDVQERCMNGADFTYIVPDPQIEREAKQVYRDFLQHIPYKQAEYLRMSSFIGVMNDLSQARKTWPMSFEWAEWVPQYVAIRLVTARVNDRIEQAVDNILGFA